MPSARPLGTRNRAFPALTSATVRLTLCTKCATPYPAIVRTLRKIFRRKRHFCRYSQQHARCQVARCFRRIPIHRAAAERPACPAGSRGCTARRCVERIDTGKRPEFPYGFALPNAQALSVRENLEDHFHTVDLLRSPFCAVRAPTYAAPRKQPAAGVQPPLQAGVLSCSSRSETHRASC